jgi:hypothetical protein
MRDSNATVGKNLLPSSMRKSWLRSDTDEPMRLTDVLTRGPLHSGFRVLSRAIPFDRLQVTLNRQPTTGFPTAFRRLQSVVHWCCIVLASSKPAERC